MKRLLVLRHAKAGPHDEKHDRERALVERGRNDAARMGRLMREKGYRPDLVLCSSARRTVETWENLALGLAATPELEFLDSLYDAPEKTILKCLRAARQTATVLLYIGHNPGLEQVARLLTRKADEAAERARAAAMAAKFPTAALAVLDFDTDDWAAIAPATAKLTDFLTPSGTKAS